MEKKKVLRAREVALELMKDPDACVWCGVWNGYADTYASVDHVFKFKYDQIQDDFFGIPGRMDSRVLKKVSEDVFYIGSLFGKVPDPDIDFGSDDIDFPISEINGKDGDPNLVWKSSGFLSEDGIIWEKEGDGWEIKYNTTTQIINVCNIRDSLRFIGKVVGIETLRNIINLCKIKLNIHA